MVHEAMSSEVRISPRDRMVLTSVIEIYIGTGEPVASQAVARQFGEKEGMSAATIRNVMASLDEAGLLEQPHTSAGRIPTARAFRFYVNQLNGAAPSAPLTPERREQIDGSFAGITSSQQFLERTSHVLALISSGVGVALAPASDIHALEHIHFSRLTAGRVLAVVVTKAGLVMDRVLALDHDLNQSELEVSARFLNENFHGWSIERIRDELARRMEQERNEYDRLMRSVHELCRKGAFNTEGSGQTIFVEGVANLLASELDRERLQQMLRALEAKQRMVELLNAYVDARQQNVRVVVGLEEAVPEMQDLVLIGAPARLDGSNFGAVAVIGPTRIHYQETMNAVSYIAQLSDRLFQPLQ